MLFDKGAAAGIFLGLEEGGLSFGAEITLNYNAEYQRRPMIGMYVVVELDRSDEAVLGRIVAISSHGRLASEAGEDMGARAVEQQRDLPEDIKQQFLRYRCSVRLLGLLREVGANILYTPSHRRLPHLGAKVAFAADDLLQVVAGARRPGASIGFLALGEFVYAEGHEAALHLPLTLQLMAPPVEPRFDASALVSRRTAVLARSGFGKSNLLKILFTRLYEHSPTIPDALGHQMAVGTLVLDPEGDYFWPGAGPSSPPGLCDVPALQDQIVVATDRRPPFPYYGSFVVSTPKVDLRTLRPALVIGIAVHGERQTQRGTEALYRLDQQGWAKLIDLAWLEHHGNQGALASSTIAQICHLSGGPSVDAIAGGIRSTLLDIVARLHHPGSTLVAAVTEALAAGKLVIVDLSLMRGTAGTELSGILLRYLFDQNVNAYTDPNERRLAVVALIEEAQTVLSGSAASTPFVEWVKEGRKYGLGAVLVTQQPGALDHEILSQTDNFFAFHLVSRGDLTALQHANGHFSDDILATLLNEPIEGHGVFWSSAGRDKTAYPIPFRAFDFATLHHRLDTATVATTPNNYASRLRNSLPQGTTPTRADIPQPSPLAGVTPHGQEALSASHRKAAAKAQAELDDLKKSRFPLFVVETWLRDSGTRKQGTKQFAIDLLTVVMGLYGYGWNLVSETNKNGRSYDMVEKLDVEDGRKRLDRGDEPLLRFDNSGNDDEDVDLAGEETVRF